MKWLLLIALAVVLFAFAGCTHVVRFEYCPCSAPPAPDTVEECQPLPLEESK